MNEFEIRLALTDKLRATNGTSALVIEELGLCQGSVFADLAVVNGHLEGYEIKGDADSLRRLPRQREVYSQVMSRAFLVVTERHLERARESVPPWWGLLLARPKGSSLEIVTLRRSKRNPTVDPVALVQLLWRDEVFGHLQQLGRSKGLSGRPRRELWARLASELPLRQLESLVCDQIKQRGDWRSA